MVVTLLHFTVGTWMLDHHARLSNLWRVPVVFAAMVGRGASAASVTVWPPLMTPVKMLGDISIALLLFSLGVRLTDTSCKTWKAGLVGAVARPMLGMLAECDEDWMTGKIYLNLKD